MITYTGRSVWPKWTEVEGVPTDIGPSLEDIAVGLGRQPRFCGQTRLYYTVLCHSFVAEQLAREFYPGNDALRRHLLLHDGHESVVCDTPTTWKGEGTRQDERDLDQRIMGDELKLAPLSERDHEAFKRIDAACLAAEAHALGHAEAEKYWPSELHDDLVRRAYRLTMGQINAGNTVRYLTPENAIAAMKKAYA